MVRFSSSGVPRTWIKKEIETEKIGNQTLTETTLIGHTQRTNHIDSCRKSGFIESFRIFGALCRLSFQLSRHQLVYSYTPIDATDYTIRYYRNLNYIYHTQRYEKRQQRVPPFSASMTALERSELESDPFVSSLWTRSLIVYFLIPYLLSLKFPFRYIWRLSPLTE